MGARCLGLFVAGSLSVLTACSTFVSGEKANSKSEGKRYFLPVPVLEVISQPNGTITVVTKYLPDFEQ